MVKKKTTKKEYISEDDESKINPLVKMIETEIETIEKTKEKTKENRINLNTTESMALIHITEEQAKVNVELHNIQLRHNELQTNLIEVMNEIFEKNQKDFSKTENVQFSDDKKIITFQIK